MACQCGGNQVERRPDGTLYCPECGEPKMDYPEGPEQVAAGIQRKRFETGTYIKKVSPNLLVCEPGDLPLDENFKPLSLPDLDVLGWGDQSNTPDGVWRLEPSIYTGGSMAWVSKDLGRGKCPECKSQKVLWSKQANMMQCQDCGMEWPPHPGA